MMDINTDAPSSLAGISVVEGDLLMSSSGSEDSFQVVEGKRRRKARKSKEKKAKNSDSPGHDVFQETELNNQINDRKRLIFPDSLELGYHLKLQWAVRLTKAHSEFEVLFKEGRNRPYLTVKDDKAVKHLTTV